ncbi:arabinofuranosyltransferase [Phytohabitans rumicis]|uniref:Galactan 5-O-arabinofuranosyltransferase n=1 Tax=Phytohabitans rumicis TaxID=1076125 RepID=A0A6V8KP09_9ACTN|nr:arabinofuranosyltransferase [Phytohabitans rumicis]GFJ86892.1 hypothetical protein Prum_005340 [Phytohabitans rumicis]
MALAAEVVEPAARGRWDWLRRVAVSARPAAFAGVVFCVVVGAVAALPSGDPLDGFFRYSLELVVLITVLVGAGLVWWAHRRGWTWDADVIPALFGGVASFSLLGMLKGTPWGPNGLQGDATFRTESVTRFADGWQLADFTYHGLPAFYAPAYFWLLGRTADLGGIEPWHMIKYGNVAAAMAVPLVAYLLWRWIVPPRVAALLAGVPLVVENFYEPYAWITLAAFIPWWLAAVHGLTRPQLRPPRPVVLGLIGAVLFMTYYYFFFIAAIALVCYLVVGRRTGCVDRRRLGRIALVLGVAATGSAVFWLPLGVSILRARESESLANRWFWDQAGIPELPFIEPTVKGGLCLLGLAFLALTARIEPLSRALLVFLAAAYAWYVIGLPAALLGMPLLTFRGLPLIPLILVTAGVLALGRLVTLAPKLLSPAHVRPLTALLAVLLGLFAARGFTVAVATSPYIPQAHSQPLPDGQLPPYHSAKSKPADVPTASIRDAIEARYTGSGNPVVVSERFDVLSLYPYHGFVQPNAHYSHPAGEFHARIAFLDRLAAASPREFARLSAQNRFDRIDAFVLTDNGDTLHFTYRDDAFPSGLKYRSVRFPRTAFDPSSFDLTDLGSVVVVVRR